LKAETHVVLCALELALLEDFQAIIIEGDAKLCFDAIEDESNAPWSI
jgi:ribonuclease HI